MTNVKINFIFICLMILNANAYAGKMSAYLGVGLPSINIKDSKVDVKYESCEIEIKVSQRVTVLNKCYFIISGEKDELIVSVPKVKYVYIDPDTLEIGGIYKEGVNEVKVDGSILSMLGVKYSLEDKITLTGEKKEFNDVVDRLTKYILKNKDDELDLDIYRYHRIIEWDVYALKTGNSKRHYLEIKIVHPLFYDDLGEHYNFDMLDSNQYVNYFVGEVKEWMKKGLGLSVSGDANISLDANDGDSSLNCVDNICMLNVIENSVPDKVSVKLKSINKMMSDNCIKELYFQDYNWRFSSDNNAKTAWCGSASLMGCGMIFVKNAKVNNLTNLSMVNGFSKSEWHFKANSRIKNLEVFYYETLYDSVKGIEKWKKDIILRIK